MKSSNQFSDQAATELQSDTATPSMSKLKKVAIFLAASSLWVAGFHASAYADDDSYNHERVRQAFASGEVLSLKDVLAKVEAQNPGEVIEIEFETDKHDKYIYEIKLLKDDGALVKLKVDATNGEVLKTKTRNKKRKND